jgi:hypothetical protein
MLTDKTGVEIMEYHQRPVHPAISGLTLYIFIAAEY